MDCFFRFCGSILINFSYVSDVSENDIFPYIFLKLNLFGGCDLTLPFIDPVGIEPDHYKQQYRKTPK